LFAFLGTGTGSPKGECLRNTDCAGPLACEQGACINPCTSLPCGPNAYCEPENHAAWCRCAVGFKEGANGACISSKFGNFAIKHGQKLIVNYYQCARECLVAEMPSAYPRLKAQLANVLMVCEEIRLPVDLALLMSAQL